VRDKRPTTEGRSVSKRQETQTAEDADTIRRAVELVYFGWFFNTQKIDWHELLDRLERTQTSTWVSEAAELAVTPPDRHGTSISTSAHAGWTQRLASHTLADAAALHRPHLLY